MNIYHQEQTIEDFNYFEQQCFKQLHILPSELNDQDYIEFMTMLNAKKPEDRVQDPMSIGMVKKSINHK